MTFDAYSPVRANQHGTVSYGDNGLTITNFKIQNEPQFQYDLLYSPRTIDATSSPVSIGFKHALSSIRFKFVKPADGAHSILVKRVEILGDILNKGDFFQDIALNSATSTGSPRWDNKIKEGNLTYTLYNSTGGFEVPASTGAEISGIYSFLPIPQQVTSNKSVRIVYATKQQSTDDYGSDIEKVIPFTDFIISGTTYTTSWDMGKRYVYHVHFGALKEIYFAPTVTDWVEVSEAGSIVL